MFLNIYSVINYPEFLLFFLANKHRSSSSRSWTRCTAKVCTVVTGETFRAHASILEQVNSAFLEVQITSPQDCDIIIVFCPITARIGSDVAAALSREEGNNVILVSWRNNVHCGLCRKIYFYVQTDLCFCRCSSHCFSVCFQLDIFLCLEVCLPFRKILLLFTEILNLKTKS